MNTDPKFIPAEIIKPAADVEQVKHEIKRDDDESQPLYMQRAGRAIVSALMREKGKLFDPSRLRESDVDPNIRALVAEVMENANNTNAVNDGVYSAELNAQAIEVVEAAISYHDKRLQGLNSNEFDTTERDRKFFETNPTSPSSKRETYWNTLFFPLITPECREFAKKFLDKKKIVLLGGGRSRLTEELEENDIHPQQILNADPYVEKPEDGSDTVVPISASSRDFKGKMSSLGIEKADEIWAEYSVPAYLEDPEEISQLFDNIDQVLAENGTARIWPLEVGGSGDDEARLIRKNALLESIRKMDSSKKYEIAIYKSAGRFGITIHNVGGQAEQSQ